MNCRLISLILAHNFIPEEEIVCFWVISEMSLYLYVIYILQKKENVSSCNGS